MKLKQLLVLFSTIVVLVLIVLALSRIDVFKDAFDNPTISGSTSLSAIVLLGLALVVLLMAVLVIVYWLLDLANKDQALALPEGSVRALIAFSLILIFVCIGAFLFDRVNSVEVTGGSGKLTKVNQAQLTELQKQFVVAYEPARKADGTAETDTDGKSPVYNVTYYSKRSKEADDFAKQIFTTLATVFVSVISFYFGSSSAMSAAKTAPRDGGVVQKITPPNIAKLDPNKIAADSPPTPLNITGDGLGSVTKVQFGSVEVKPDKVADKLVNVTVPASILVQPGIVKVSVVAPNGESSTLDLTVS